MEVVFILLCAFIGAEICNAQYDQYQYAQTYQRAPPGYNNQQQQYYQRVPAGYVRRQDVRPKPRHGRVNPDDYISMLNQRKQQQQVVVYPKRYVQRVQYVKQVQQPSNYIPYQKNHWQQQQYQQQYQQQNANPYLAYKRTNVYNPNTRYQPRWPKLRGHCKVVPDNDIDGVDPIKAECSKGRTVVVFLMKRRCDFCYHQLRELNTLALHYKKTGKKLSVIVINHKRGPLSPALVEKYPGLTFYEEPLNKDIFRVLGGVWRDTIVFDVCCRKQYLFGYPFSWMGYRYVRHAIFNTMYYDQVLCGSCKVKTANTTITPTKEGEERLR